MRLAPFWLRFNKKCMSGVGKKKEAPGRGVLFDLPLHLQVNILSRIPILELRRLHKGKVSPRFSAAIKRTLGEITLKCQEAVLDADRSGNQDTDAYKQAYKVQYLFTDVAEWQVNKGYSAPGCGWRDGPLSSFPPEEATWWNFGDADRGTWIEGGRKFQLNITPNPWEQGWTPEPSEEQGSDAQSQQ
jgi:hypothetical protein